MRRSIKRRLALSAESIRTLGELDLARAVGGAVPATYAQDRCTSDQINNCPTTGPWVTEWSCLTCNCNPQ